MAKSANTTPKTEKKSKGTKFFDYKDFNMDWLPPSANTDNRASERKSAFSVKRDAKIEARRAYYGK